MILNLVDACWTGATVGSDADGNQYWKVQNSWGDDWVNLCVASAHAGVQLYCSVLCSTCILYNWTVYCTVELYCTSALYILGGAVL